MKLRPFFLSLLLALGTARADEFEARTFTSPDGHSIGYRLLKPANYDAKKKYPLVLFLHGAGERGSDNSAQLKHGTALFLKPEVRAQFACFVMAPQCPAEQKWADIDWSSDAPKMAAEVSAPMKLTLAALEGTLRLYLEPGRAAREIPVLRMLGDSEAQVLARAERLAELTGGETEKTVARVGGGALPLAELPSFACAIVSERASPLRSPV